MTNCAHCFAIIFRASSNFFKNTWPRCSMISLHSSTVLSSNLANVMKRENSSLAETTAVMGWFVPRISFTADWMVECSSCTVSTGKKLISGTSGWIVRHILTFGPFQHHQQCFDRSNASRQILIVVQQSREVFHHVCMKCIQDRFWNFDNNKPKLISF